ncbi:nuclease SbcCD subunit C-like [Stegodyphus dumicola]|uniref:nuclease SbcCD subunit C-like n=1 Tax=Stegodyphus dumicola TaxID=202533 RepID=UPI0015A9F6FD|nr:nuclease SbcCD subunit C-like [Stegodyphus dumicola]
MLKEVMKLENILSRQHFKVKKNEDYPKSIDRRNSSKFLELVKNALNSKYENEFLIKGIHVPTKVLSLHKLTNISSKSLNSSEIKNVKYPKILSSLKMHEVHKIFNSRHANRLKRNIDDMSVTDRIMEYEEESNENEELALSRQRDKFHGDDNDKFITYKSPITGIKSLIKRRIPYKTRHESMRNRNSELDNFITNFNFQPKNLPNLPLRGIDEFQSRKSNFGESYPPVKRETQELNTGHFTLGSSFQIRTKNSTELNKKFKILPKTYLNTVYAKELDVNANILRGLDKIIRKLDNLSRGSFHSEAKQVEDLLRYIERMRSDQKGTSGNIPREDKPLHSHKKTKVKPHYDKESHNARTAVDVNEKGSDLKTNIKVSQKRIQNRKKNLEEMQVEPIGFLFQNSAVGKQAKTKDDIQMDDIIRDLEQRPQIKENKSKGKGMNEGTIEQKISEDKIHKEKEENLFSTSTPIKNGKKKIIQSYVEQGRKTGDVKSKWKANIKHLGNYQIRNEMQDLFTKEWDVLNAGKKKNGDEATEQDRGIEKKITNAEERQLKDKFTGSENIILGISNKMEKSPEDKINDRRIKWKENAESPEQDQMENEMQDLFSKEEEKLNVGEKNGDEATEQDRGIEKEITNAEDRQLEDKFTGSENIMFGNRNKMENKINNRRIKWKENAEGPEEDQMKNEMQDLISTEEEVLKVGEKESDEATEQKGMMKEISNTEETLMEGTSIGSKRIMLVKPIDSADRQMETPLKSLEGNSRKETHNYKPDDWVILQSYITETSASRSTITQQMKENDSSEILDILKVLKKITLLKSNEFTDAMEEKTERGILNMDLGNTDQGKRSKAASSKIFSKTKLPLGSYNITLQSTAKIFPITEKYVEDFVLRDTYRNAGNQSTNFDVGLRSLNTLTKYFALFLNNTGINTANQNDRHPKEQTTYLQLYPYFCIFLSIVVFVLFIVIFLCWYKTWTRKIYEAKDLDVVLKEKCSEEISQQHSRKSVTNNTKDESSIKTEDIKDSSFASLEERLEDVSTQIMDTNKSRSLEDIIQDVCTKAANDFALTKEDTARLKQRIITTDKCERIDQMLTTNELERAFYQSKSLTLLNEESRNKPIKSPFKSSVDEGNFDSSLITKLGAAPISSSGQISLMNMADTATTIATKNSVNDIAQK